MKEHKGNLWDVVADAFVITTNLSVRHDGAAVMGRGCALEAKMKWPGIEFMLGSNINAGKLLHVLDTPEYPLIIMPVKYRWRDRANLRLIEASAHQLIGLTEALGYKVVAMPRPGCGNGGLDWNEVRQLLLSVGLDDRFIVCDYA
jgi:hypothetical protein